MLYTQRISLGLINQQSNLKFGFLKDGQLLYFRKKLKNVNNFLLL